MNRFQLRRSLWATALFVLVLALVQGCKRVIAPQAPLPPEVTVSRPVTREVVRWDQYSGYLSSPQTVVVNARVSGLVEDAPFQEGAIVHEGDLLFRIDPRPFKADLDNKISGVAQVKASVERTKADFRRSTLLIKAQVIAP